MTAALQLIESARTDKTSRLVLADYWLEQGRRDVADLMLDRLPSDHGEGPKRTKKRIDKLTKAQAALMPEWAKRWIGVGLCTQPADRALFEAAVAACYRYTGLPEPRVVWCPSPIVAALAGPIAAKILRDRGYRGGAVGDAVHGAVRGAVHGSVHGAVGGAVHGAVRGAVDGAVHGAVDGAVHDAVHRAVHGADSSVLLASGSEWWRRFGGQFWVGGWWWGSPAFVSFFVDACALKLDRDIELRARAYAATCMSACWWWPHRDFVIVSERPSKIVIESGELKLAQWDGWAVTP